MSSLYYKSHQNRGRQSLRQDAVLSNSSLGVAGQEQSSGLGLSAGVESLWFSAAKTRRALREKKHHLCDFTSQATTCSAPGLFNIHRNYTDRYTYLIDRDAVKVAVQFHRAIHPAALVYTSV